MSNKRIALYDKVTIDGVSFGNGFVRSVEFTSEDEQVDASGFNASGSDEILAGKRALSVTVEFFMTRASNEVHQVLYPLHRDKTIFDFEWYTNQNASVSSTNPALRGSVKLPSWTEGATRGEVETATLTFLSDPSNPLEFYYT